MIRNCFAERRWIFQWSVLLTITAALAGCHGSGTPGSTTNPSSTIKAVPAAPSPATDKAVAMNIFNQQCAQCHSIGAIGKKDSIPLDHEGSSRTQKWLEVQIRHPEIHNPKTLMPLFPTDRISDKDMKALTSYLSSLK